MALGRLWQELRFLGMIYLSANHMLLSIVFMDCVEDESVVSGLLVVKDNYEY